MIIEWQDLKYVEKYGYTCAGINSERLIFIKIFYKSNLIDIVKKGEEKTPREYILEGVYIHLIRSKHKYILIKYLNNKNNRGHPSR